MDFKNISSTFSPESDAILFEIMKKNNLGESGGIAELILTKISMLFSREEISEKEMIDSIQKELNLPQRTAEQIAKEIKNNLIPTLWDKMPQEERDALLNKKGETLNVLPEIKPPLDVEKVLVEQQNPFKEKITKPSKIEKIINPAPKKKSRLPQKPISEKLTSKQPQKQDTYREPIE